jgi:hypothetical protein
LLAAQQGVVHMGSSGMCARTLELAERLLPEPVR